MKPIGFIQEGDSKHKSLWWVMPDGSKNSGCPDYLLKEIQAVYLKQEAGYLLTACKHSLKYSFSVGLNNLVKKTLNFLTSIQRFVGWPR